MCPRADTHRRELARLARVMSQVVTLADPDALLTIGKAVEDQSWVTQIHVGRSSAWCCSARLVGDNLWARRALNCSEKPSQSVVVGGAAHRLRIRTLHER